MNEIKDETADECKLNNEAVSPTVSRGVSRELADRLGVYVSPDGRVTPAGAAKLRGISPRSLRRMRDEKRGPKAERLPLLGCSFSYYLRNL